jgi:gamma-glutamyltranspeptidase / glutathione hydrolase
LRGYDIRELPPNSQGIAVLQILSLLEPYDLKALGPQSAEALHLMIEAKKLAYEDRAKFYADLEFAKVPVAELISKPYAARRGKLIDPARANARPSHGDPKPADTIYMTVADKAGNAVSLIQSNFNSFGSSRVAGELGFVLQNRGSSFALDPSHANCLEPHKRPFDTIIPGFVTKDGKAWLSFGLIGGDTQAQGHAQVLVNIIDFGMDVQAACDAPRFYHLLLFIEGKRESRSDPPLPERSGWPTGRRALTTQARAEGSPHPWRQG